METLYFQIQTNVKANGENILSAVLPLLKLLTLTIFGLILANPKVQLVHKDTFKLLSKLVFALFLPCLILIQLGESITLENFFLWWFIPVNVFLSTIIGCLLGLLVAVICRPPPEFVRFTVIVTGLGNTGNLSLAIVRSVCHSTDNPFGKECDRTGVAYVSFAQWVAVLIVCTFVYHMMEPPLEYYDIIEENTEIEDDQDSPAKNLSTPLLVEAEWPGMEDKETQHCKTPFIARVFAVPDPDYLEQGEPESPESINCLAETHMVRKIRIVAVQTPIRQIFQPPMIATLLAFIIGMVPPFKMIVYGDDAPLSFITESFDILAGAMVPSVMLVLGGMIAEGPNVSRLGLRTTIGIIVARLLVLPMIGIGVVYLADRMNFLIAGDEMYRFVLLLQYTTPSAILLGAIASLRGYAVSEASALLFWQHVFAVFSISMFIILYFKMLLSYD